MNDASQAEPKTMRSMPDLPTPLYHQIQLVIRERIDQGYYGREGMLPSEMDLSREFKVSRITVARAINELAALGLVERKRGAGTRIVPREIPPAVPANIDGLLESLTSMGNSTQVTVLEFGFVLPAYDVQTELEVGANELVQRAVRVRSYNGAPFSYLTSFVPGHIGHNFDESDMAVNSLLSLLEKNGVKVGSARQAFSAVLADPKIAQALDVPVGTPLLAISRTVCDREERPVEYIRILYRTDRYQYRMTMERDKGGADPIWSTKDRKPPTPRRARKQA
ncbi:GntR family transcriptional regulator [Mesorhizobium sp. CAU 1732]|uniref:GntR family transcriptional regulator n=1 Tax=Mesorhizobium sp. CAU 1732 TaxID=3140358 RepID=UPI003261D475